MSKVLFTHSYFLRFDPKQWKLQKPYPPLGTIYAAALLRDEGHEVALFDSMFARGPEELLPYLDDFQPDILVIYDDGFNYLTKMCLTNMREAAFKMAETARDRGIRVAACSSDSTDHFEAYLSQGVEVVIRGEGEQTLSEWVSHCAAGGGEPEGIPGMVWKQGEETRDNGPRPVLRDLDSLPTPAWDLIDIRPYKAAWSQHGYFSINMATTRGCPYKCNWCAKPIYGNRYNSHSPEAKADELQMLVEKFGVEHVWFCDDIFGLKPGWVQAFAEELEKRKLKIRFMIQSRVDLLLRDDTVAALARAGCEWVWLGAESGSQRILDAMDKGTTVDQIREARNKLREHGIRTAFFLQFGYLGETLEDIRATFRMLEQCMPDDIGVSVSYPLPGTAFYEKVKADLGEKANWTDSDDLAMMFRNTFRPEFYKNLHRYVHKRYRKKQSLAAWRRPFAPGNLRRALSLFYYIPATANERRKLKSTLPEADRNVKI